MAKGKGATADTVLVKACTDTAVPQGGGVRGAAKGLKMFGDGDEWVKWGRAEGRINRDGSAGKELPMQ